MHEVQYFTPYYCTRQYRIVWVTITIYRGVVSSVLKYSGRDCWVRLAFCSDMRIMLYLPVPFGCVAPIVLTVTRDFLVAISQPQTQLQRKNTSRPPSNINPKGHHCPLLAFASPKLRSVNRKTLSN